MQARTKTNNSYPSNNAAKNQFSQHLSNDNMIANVKMMASHVSNVLSNIGFC